MSSSRLPKKMLMKLGNGTLIEYVYNRCKQAKLSDDVIVITSDDKSDDDLFRICKEKKIPVYRGSLNDVLKRYIDASNNFDVELICRVCGDSPFVDVSAIDSMFGTMMKNKHLDYISTVNSLNGFMSEVLTLKVLKNINDKKLYAEDREHVTKYIRDNMANFKVKKLELDLRPVELEKFTLTIDYPEDLIIAQNIVKHLNGFKFSSDDILKILKNIG